eukprot:TRINITY_DN26623_c0_g1_i1.p2 TRINITY_DN26623_c0_g1~~TRINITY_DN26623_c0_g1_i1.p2  ORF type:complete len:307 (+),score=81.15 TRINITY_DN26623_c0_g1_i1:75-923(+)
MRALELGALLAAAAGSAAERQWACVEGECVEATAGGIELGACEAACGVAFACVRGQCVRTRVGGLPREGCLAACGPPPAEPEPAAAQPRRGAERSKQEGSAGKARAKRPSEIFDELQDLAGHYAVAMCKRAAKARGLLDGPRSLRVRSLGWCHEFSDHIEHMVAVSGNDAIIQLGDGKRSSRAAPKSGRVDPARYYAKAVDVAGSGAHLAQLLKISRKAADWMLDHPQGVAKDRLNEFMKPHIGQWLINVASSSDPSITSKEMRDEPPEDPLSLEEEDEYTA